MSFWLHGCCWEWEGGPVNRLTSWVAVFTLTDRPKSVCNCCLIELFVCVVTLLFWHFCWCTCRGFCHKTKSDLLFVMITPLTISTCTCIWLNLIYIRSSPFGFQLNDVDAGGATVFQIWMQEFQLLRYTMWFYCNKTFYEFGLQKFLDTYIKQKIWHIKVLQYHSYD